MKLQNIYDIEVAIKQQLVNDNVVPANSIYTAKNAQDFTNDNFINVPDENAVAVLIYYEGFQPDRNNKSGRGSSLAQQVKVRYRVVVVSPESLYYDNAGVKFVQVVDSIKGLTSETYCKHQLVKDDHEFNTPDFSNNMCSIPQVWEFDAIL